MAIPIDLDGDGLMDVITASEENFLLSWYRNLDNGYFESEVILNDVPVYYLSIHLIDLNNDNLRDILYHGNNPSEIAWLKAQDGGGHFAEKETIFTSTGYFFWQIMPFDINDDGRSDIIAIKAYSDYREIVWYENLGNGNFGSSQLIYQHHDDLGKFILADIDGDGKMDLVVSDMVYEPASIFWL